MNNIPHTTSTHINRDFHIKLYMTKWILLVLVKIVMNFSSLFFNCSKKNLFFLLNVNIVLKLTKDNLNVYVFFFSCFFFITILLHC